jgi:uncharacterized protein DUF2752
MKSSARHIGTIGAPLVVAASAVCVCAAVWAGDPTTPGGPLPLCPTKLVLGIDCPGCGTLRMLYSLMHADVLGALRFNAVALVALPLLGWAYLAWSYHRITGGRLPSWQYYRWAPRVTLLVVSVWLVVRNLPFGPFPVLHV